MVSGFIAGNRATHVFFISAISSILFGGFGFGVYTVLESKVPEFIELLRSLLSFGGGSADEDMESGGKTFRGSSMPDMNEKSSGSESDMQDITQSERSAPRQKDGVYGDHIIVENIKIKNEPKLMAEAIRTMLAKDETSG